MKPYRASHQSTIKAGWYENIVYGPLSYDSYLWEEEKKILDLELRFLLKKNSNPHYLDFACGTGRVIGHLERRVAESVGVDISEEMLDGARLKLAHSEIIRGDLTRADMLPGREFDLVTAFRFFLNAEPELREESLLVLARKLADGGALIFNIHGNTWSFRFVMVLWYRFIKGRRLNHLSYWKVKKLLERYGFAIERLYGIGVVPKPLYRFLPRFIFRIIDGLWILMPFSKYFSYNLIFVCRKK